MVISTQAPHNLVHDIKFSSVVPAKVTGDNKNHELTGIDLAMKLHYIKALYFFTNNNNNNNNDSGITNNKNASKLVDIDQLKQTMFDWLVPYFVTCGRICSPSDQFGGQFSIKLNDAGVRIVEAKSDKTVEEWLTMDGFADLGLDHLVYGDHIGDNGLGLGFTPLVFIQRIH